MWTKSIKDCIRESSTTQNIIDVVLNEYVGNLTYPRFNNKRLVLTYKHDHLYEIVDLTRNNPLIKKLNKDVQLLLELSPINLNTLTKIENKYSLFPINGKLKAMSSITSKNIRNNFKIPIANSCKMITSPDPDIIINLGLLISKLTNVRNKTVLLRAIHGDVYCGTRLKNFGMSETDLCPRCATPETISHQLMECPYVCKIWEIITKITGIKITTLNQVLGHDPIHDKITLTLHAEIIRQLMAIDRPTVDPLNLVIFSVKSLSIVESGITKLQIRNMLHKLEKFT